MEDGGWRTEELLPSALLSDKHAASGGEGGRTDQVRVGVTRPFTAQVVETRLQLSRHTEPGTRTGHKRHI